MSTHNMPMQSKAIEPSHRGDRGYQPLQALQLPDALLKMQTVTQATGISSATVYRGVAAGTFPQPVRMGKRCTRWRAVDVRAWIQAQGVTA